MCAVCLSAQDNQELIAPPEGLTAEQVIANYIKARGGRENLAKIKDIYTEMEVSTKQGNVLVIIAEKAPDKKAIIQKSDELIIARQVFSSTKLILNEEVLTSGERFENAKHAGLMHPELDYKKHGYALKLLGQRNLDGRPVYVVEVTKPSGEKETHSYEVSTGLLVQLEDPIGGTQQFSSYLSVDGVRFPYLVTIVSPSKLAFRVKTVKVNQGVEDTFFE